MFLGKLNKLGITGKTWLPEVKFLAKKTKEEKKLSEEERK